MSDETIHPYYEGRKVDVLAEFDATIDAFEHELVDALGGILARDIDRDAVRASLRREMTYVLANLPYVGGDAGRMTKFFELYAPLIAVGRALRGLGLATPENHALMRRYFLSRMDKIPSSTLLAEGEEWMSQRNRDYLREEAKKSRRKKNPDDFVYRFVEGAASQEDDGVEFGIDYTECGFCKLCARTGDRDLLPVMCDMDEEIYAMRGVALSRSTTLASGGARCDFRFRATRKPPSDR